MNKCMKTSAALAVAIALGASARLEAADDPDVSSSARCKAVVIETRSGDSERYSPIDLYTSAHRGSVIIVR